MEIPHLLIHPCIYSFQYLNAIHRPDVLGAGYEAMAKFSQLSYLISVS